MDSNDITPFAVYIVTNRLNSVLYIGVTNDLNRRIIEHKAKMNEKSFSARYNLNKLVYFEKFQSMSDAIRREKQLKHWNRIWKNELIEKVNPEWNDLFEC